MAQARINFLTGSPAASSLEWAEHVLHDEPLPQFLRYLDTGRTFHMTITSNSASTAVSNWRHVPLGRQIFYESPAHMRNNGVIAGLSSIHRNRDFLEHSYAVLDDLQSSQIAPQNSADQKDETMLFTTTSFSTAISEDSSLLLDTSSLGDQTMKTPVRQVFKFVGSITSVKAIPRADQLNRMHPQTMTVNLIVGIINVSPSKSVMVRRGNYSMDIVEILVGDETKAGFSISTWLSPIDSQHQANDGLRESLQGLRSGDVVLIERVALSTFKEQVFGQSLNRKTTKNVTRFVVIRSSLGAEQEGIRSSVAGKIQKVRDWVDQFVGPSKKHGMELDEARRGKRINRGQTPVTALAESLPPDSQ